jgi:hypothetical protein
MTEIGEIKRGQEIGKKDTSLKYIWVACMNCGNERWVELRRQNRYKHCRKCNGGNPVKRGAESSSWKGGQIISYKYVMIKLQSDDFFYSMANSAGYVFEHRLVMAKHLGRCLQSWEIIHHKNHIRTDNRIENLQLVSGDKHTQITILENKIKMLEKRILILETKLKGD